MIEIAEALRQAIEQRDTACAECNRQAEIIEAMRAALVGCEALITAWMEGPLMNHIEWIKSPPALVAARAALELR